MSSNGRSGKIRQTEFVSYVITFVWVVSFFVDIFVRSYEPPPTVHALMMLVAGALFGEGLVRRRGDSSNPPVTPPAAPDERGS